MTKRILVLLALVVVAGALRLQTRVEAVSTASSLAGIPMAVGLWQGRPAARYSPDVVAALGVEQYIHRTYASDDGRTANLYLGYHASQSQGSSIHSPMNCLPGAGWEPQTVERIPFGSGTARRVVIRKGSDRMLVIYWYQTMTHIEGEEYRGRFYSVVDTLRHGRNDAALVRVTVPIGDGHDGEPRAAAAAMELASGLLPYVSATLFPPAA